MNSWIGRRRENFDYSKSQKYLNEPYLIDGEPGRKKKYHDLGPKIKYDTTDHLSHAAISYKSDFHRLKYENTMNDINKRDFRKK